MTVKSQVRHFNFDIENETRMFLVDYELYRSVKNFRHSKPPGSSNQDTGEGIQDTS